MNNKHQENGVLTGPLIFTLPASSFVVVLSFNWLEGTKPAAASAKTHGSDYLATRPENGERFRGAGSLASEGFASGHC
jgi:hypothetical protein